MMKEHLSGCQAPSVLEVGVDRGVTFITLMAFLARTCPDFLAIGVDVLVQEQVQVMLAHLDMTKQQQAYLVKGNSLAVLPKLVEQRMQFDLLLIDGDHNYYTVCNELQHVEKLLKPGGLVVIDDYNGRWGLRDLYYAERDGYADVKDTTARVDTEKHGVKPAVDEWVAAHPEWERLTVSVGEPVVIRRRN